MSQQVHLFPPQWLQRHKQLERHLQAAHFEYHEWLKNTGIKTGLISKKTDQFIISRKKKRR